MKYTKRSVQSVSSFVFVVSKAIMKMFGVWTCEQGASCAVLTLSYISVVLRGNRWAFLAMLGSWEREKSPNMGFECKV